MNHSLNFRRAGLAIAAAAGTLTSSFAQDAPGVAGTPLSPQATQALQHLDFGGPFFAYVETKGDLEGIADRVHAFMDQFPEKPPGLERWRPRQILDIIGLDGLEAVGASSVTTDAGFRNKAYLHLANGRNGVFSVLGGEPAPLKAPVLLPSNCDVVIERDLDLTRVPDIVRKFASLMPEREAGKATRMLTEPLPIGMSLGEFLTRSQGKLIVAARFDRGAPMQLPNAPFKVPFPEVIVILDGFDWMFESLTATMPEQARQMIEGAPGSRRLKMGPIGPGAYEKIQPLLIEDRANQRLVFTTSPEFFGQLSGEASLSTSADFLKATEGLPLAANGLTYLSSNAKKAVADLRDEFLAAMKQENAGRNVASTRAGVMFSPVLLSMFGGESLEPEAHVQVNREDGLHFVGNAPYSMKSGLTVLPVVPGLFFAGYANARSTAYREEARLHEEDAKQIEEAIREAEEAQKSSSPQEPE